MFHAQFKTEVVPPDRCRAVRLDAVEGPYVAHVLERASRFRGPGGGQMSDTREIVARARCGSGGMVRRAQPAIPCASRFSASRHVRFSSVLHLSPPQHHPGTRSTETPWTTAWPQERGSISEHHSVANKLQVNPPRGPDLLNSGVISLLADAHSLPVVVVVPAQDVVAIGVRHRETGWIAGLTVTI